MHIPTQVTNYGKICKKIEIEQTQTISPPINIPEPTLTLNFYIGSVHSEEILSIECAQNLFNQLKQFINDK